MIKKYKKTLIITSIISLLPILEGLILWNKLPEQIATHFGTNNIPDQYSSKAFAVFGLPFVILAIHWLAVLATNTDPKKKNISHKAISIVLWICPLLSVFLCSLTYAYALNNEIRIGIAVILFMGVLFVVLGNYMPKCKQNYTFGVKIPWTMNDSENWNKTHRFAGKIMVVGGIFLCLTSFLENPFVFFPVVIAMAFAPIIYSYLLYKKKQ